MYQVIRRADQEQFPNRTIKFEGQPYGGQVSFFLVDNEPGQGSKLHVHPYTETWIVRSGKAEFTVGEKTVRAEAGDIVVAAPDIPHRFLNVGEGRMELVCIHASDHIIQELV